MKSLFYVFRERSLLDMFGLMAVLLLLTINAFHFNIHEAHVYYRELFGVFFIGLSLWYLLLRYHSLIGDAYRMNKAIFYLILFPMLLMLWSFMDPGEPIYGDYLIGETTSQIDDTRLTLYVLRNALLYLPMVVYCYIRGINKQEIQLIALVMILVAPFSVNEYLQSIDLAALGTLGAVVEKGKGVAYNTYVPYLTFSVLCGLFLLFSRINLPLKVVVLLCTVIVGMFCLFSNSRQSVLFVALSLGGFFCFSNEGTKRKGKWLSLISIFMAAIMAFSYFTQDYDMADNFMGRFGSLEGFMTQDTSGRIENIVNGFLLLNPVEWFVGAGLTSVVTSGPHNDFIRWTQRVGVPLMIIGFMPFFISFRTSFLLACRNRKNNTLFIFLVMAVGFTFFHSMFGYPREESNQAVAVYLGLAMWFGAKREGLLKKSQLRHSQR
jgi:hypothetical protein